MATKAALEQRIAKIKKTIKEIQGRQETGTLEKIRQLRKRLKRSQRKLRRLAPPEKSDSVAQAPSGAKGQ
jgi:uncharacterized membrane protein (DUF106 family)